MIWFSTLPNILQCFYFQCRLRDTYHIWYATSVFINLVRFCITFDFGETKIFSGQQWDWIRSNICDDHSDPEPSFCESSIESNFMFWVGKTYFRRIIAIIHITILTTITHASIHVWILPSSSSSRNLCSFDFDPQELFASDHDISLFCWSNAIFYCFLSFM